MKEFKRTLAYLEGMEHFLWLIRASKWNFSNFKALIFFARQNSLLTGLVETITIGIHIHMDFSKRTPRFPSISNEKNFSRNFHYESVSSAFDVPGRCLKFRIWYYCPRKGGINTWHRVFLVFLIDTLNPHNLFDVHGSNFSKKYSA